MPWEQNRPAVGSGYKIDTPCEQNRLQGFKEHKIDSDAYKIDMIWEQNGHATFID